jgi:hypothetical protein
VCCVNPKYQPKNTFHSIPNETKIENQRLICIDYFLTGDCDMKKIVLSLVLAVLLASCSSVDYILVPTDLTRQENSKLFAKAEQEGITLTARYSHKREGDVFFDVEIYNNTGRDFSFAAKDFYYIACDTVAPPQNKICSDYPVLAFDPGMEIKLIKDATEQSKEDEKIEKAAVGVGFGISLIAALISGDTKEEKATGAVGSAIGAAGTYAAVDAEFEDYREHLGNELIFWSKTAVNDTVIKTGDYISGKVGFPYTPGEHDLYQIFLPTTEGDLMVEFKSVEIER